MRNKRRGEKEKRKEGKRKEGKRNEGKRNEGGGIRNTSFDILNSSSLLSICFMILRGMRLRISGEGGETQSYPRFPLVLWNMPIFLSSFFLAGHGCCVITTLEDIVGKERV